MNFVEEELVRDRIYFKKFTLTNEEYVLIFDGTYYKKANIIGLKENHIQIKKKAFTICTTDGFVVDLPSPILEDATIIKKVVENFDGIRNILKIGNISTVK